MEKKKLTGSLPAKIAAVCLVIVCLAVSAVSAFAVVILDSLHVYNQDKKEWIGQFNGELLDRFSIYAIANYMNENMERLEELNQTNFRYGIIRSDDLNEVDFDDTKSYLAGNIDREVSQESVHIYSCFWNAYTNYDYNMSLFGYAWAQDEPAWEYRPVEGYYYNRMDEQLFVKVDGILYRYGAADSPDVMADGVVLNNAFLDESGTDWQTPSMEIVLTAADLYLSASDVKVVDDAGLRAQGWINTDWTVETVENGMAYMPGDADPTRYFIVSYIRDPLVEGAGFHDSDLFAQARQFADFAYAYRYAFVVSLFASAILAIAAFVFLMCAAGHRNGVDGLCRRPWDAIPLDVNFSGVFWISAALVFAVIYAGGELNPLENITFWLIAVSAGSAVILLVTGWSMSFALWWKLGKWWRHTLTFVLCKYCWKGCKAVWRFSVRAWICLVEFVRSIRFLWKAWLALGLIAGIELAAACVAYRTEMFVFLCIEKLVLYPAVIFALLQLNRLRDGGKRLAGGDLTGKIDTSRMYWEFKRHGENLNAIGDGMNAAVNERMKSERFKTELITNVSHDIKTPLTSIINYVDLLGREQIDNPKAAEYLEVLNRQSARLKKLIGDLIEASKASTGNLPVSMEICDAGVTLVQTIGEYEEKLAQGKVVLQIKEPDEQILIEADSRHLWRVFDNLMNNICKYAQPGTRAYVNLEKKDGRAVIIFRNISREPLNITSEELMERFVRGDGSRGTEGNGLGLSIARSLTGLMGGSLELVVDGDLFKVVLSFPVCGGNAG